MGHAGCNYARRVIAAPSRPRRIGVAALVIVGTIAGLAVSAGCGSSTPAASARPTSTAQPLATAPPVGAKPKGAKVANPVPGTAGEIANVKSSVTNLDIYPSEGAPTPAGQLPNPWVYHGANNTSANIPRSMLVREDKGEWLQVYTGERPTGSVGWIKASDVEIVPARYHIEITLSAFKLRAFDGDAVMLDAPIAIGQGPRPTLPGLHFLNVLLQVPTDAKSQLYGPYAFGLSAYSEDEQVRKDFPGGQLGLHGTDDPSSIGKAVSNGCIRLSNENITMLAKALPLGTPVVITA